MTANKQKLATVDGMLSLRPSDAKIPHDEENARVLRDFVNTLDTESDALGLERSTDSERAALWCVDPVDTFRMLDDYVARCGHDEDEVEHIKKELFAMLEAAGLTTAEHFLKAFPQTKRDFHTGGGCMAWEISLADGGYILVTHPDGGYQPELTDLVVGCGSYTSDGSWNEENDASAFDQMTWDEAITWVRAKVSP